MAVLASKNRAMAARPRKKFSTRSYSGKLAARITALRDERHMTVEAFAHAVGVSPQTVYSWECNRTTPHMDDLPRLAKVFGIPIAELMP